MVRHPTQFLARRGPRMATVRVIVLAITASLTGHARADRVELADGRVLEGRFALLAGVAVDPIAAASGNPGGGTPVLMCDDELTRTMVSKRQVVKTEPGPVDLNLERIRIPQRVPDSGRRVTGIGSILATTPFDEFGRRIISLATAGGRVDLVQGVTEITPRWTRLEGVVTENPLLLDMRMATSSIPRDALKRIIDQQIDRRNSDHRLRVVRLMLQAERYEDAKRELDEVLRDFPDLADLAVERKDLANLSARRMLDEILLRGRVGQDRLALRMLEKFPVDDASGELLEEVREVRDRYRDRQEHARDLMQGLEHRLQQLEEGVVRRDASAILEEMRRELGFATLDRLATFERLGTDPAMPADRAVALAVNGWLRGAAAGGDNLKVALSAARLRVLVREYLRSPDEPARNELFERMKQEEAFEAAALAELARYMRPPLDPPPASTPGLHELTVPGLTGEPDVRCLVQLPPEYDPLRKYPTIVSLHASWSTPLNQIEWWAGMPGPDGTRQGPAARHGMIVVAPAWAREHQSTYDYSAREHMAVLGSVREAARHFGIDTDRVFLSGHSMGGDAAWDIALAHPDTWAGLIAITPGADRYVHHYWQNARSVPLYLVGGELDGTALKRNAMDLDRYFSRGFDATYVEYRGRGHEPFSDEILRIFDWMSRRTRTFFPTSIEAVSLRPWDRFFWWLEFEEPPPRTVVLPAQWPPPSGTKPFAIEGQMTPGNTVSVRCGAGRVRVWLSPELIDFSRPATVTVNGQRLLKGRIAADERVLLEDLRLRADRQHPFWAVADSAR